MFEQIIVLYRRRQCIDNSQCVFPSTPTLRGVPKDGCKTLFDECLLSLLGLVLGLVLHTPAIADNEPITPLPLNVEFNQVKAQLGKMLFFDTRLSSDNSISCASCHELDTHWGTDRKAVSNGVGNKMGSRNSPTVYNAVFNFAQFWDGRAENLAQQARGPVLNPVEMGMSSWEEVVKKIKSDVKYAQTFKAVYGTEMNADNIVEAIAEFEKTLITSNSPFDQYLRGSQSAINDQQKRGYQLFKSYGCVSCHQGRNVGGNMFQKLGVLKDISLEGGTLANDLGRFNLTQNEWDKRVFKVPSLRLAVKTPPYFHDGSVDTIEDAVGVMIRVQLGRDVPEADKQAIIAFLASLVGEIPQGIR